MSQITLPSVQVSRMHLNYLFVGGHLFPKSTEGLKNSEKNVGYTAAYKGVGHWQAGCEPPSFKPFSFQHASVFLLVSCKVGHLFFNCAEKVYSFIVQYRTQELIRGPCVLCSYLLLHWVHPLVSPCNPAYSLRISFFASVLKWCIFQDVFPIFSPDLSTSFDYHFYKDLAAHCLSSLAVSESVILEHTLGIVPKPCKWDSGAYTAPRVLHFFFEQRHCLKSVSLFSQTVGFKEAV